MSTITTKALRGTRKKLITAARVWAKINKGFNNGLAYLFWYVFASQCSYTREVHTAAHFEYQQSQQCNMEVLNSVNVVQPRDCTEKITGTIKAPTAIANNRVAMDSAVIFIFPIITPNSEDPIMMHTCKSNHTE